MVRQQIRLYKVEITHTSQKRRDLCWYRKFTAILVFQLLSLYTEDAYSTLKTSCCFSEILKDPLETQNSEKNTNFGVPQ